MRSIVLIGLLFVFTGHVNGQHRYRGGFLPQINVTHSFSANWKSNFQVQSRQFLLQGSFNDEPNAEFVYNRTDLTLMLARKTGVRSSLAGGYMIRFVEGETAHRLKQQYSLVRAYDRFRLGHRFAADQTFRSLLPTEFRFRYRISLEIPLSGYAIDPREFYVKANMESLLSSLEEVDLEIRGVTLLGYNITDRNRIETGMDYRINDFLRQYSSQNFWWFLGWYLRV